MGKRLLLSAEGIQDTRPVPSEAGSLLPNKAAKKKTSA
jgi:hypothetical protein